MRLALIPLLMIPLTLSCGSKDDAIDEADWADEGAVGCQNMCEEWFTKLEDVVSYESKLEDCKNIGEASDCEGCAEAVFEHSLNKWRIITDCACYFYTDDNCGLQPGDSEWENWQEAKDPYDTPREKVLALYGGESGLAEMCLEGCTQE
jgi:hypothetical protein